MDDLGVQVLLQLLAAVGVSLDDRDLIAFADEASGDEGGSFATPG